VCGADRPGGGGVRRSALEKVTKKHGLQYVCNTEGCGYGEDAEPVEATA
jgi:hypothetical protein